MNLRHLLRVVGLTLVAVSGALALSTLVAVYYGDGDAPALLASTTVVAAVGALAYARGALVRALSIREGYAVVSMSWIVVGLAGALPYLLAGVVSSPVAAVFESVSGFTTTGATVFAEIETQPRGILFWRSLTQWLGGMGIIVLGIAILPFLGVGGMQLFRAEVPGPTPERLRPRIAQTAKLLWLVYAGLTAAQAALFLLGGVDVYDAVTHAMTTLSTGGFSPRDGSLADFDTRYVQYVTVVFMYLAGVNFALHYRALTGEPRRYLADGEWRFFTMTVSAATAIVFLVLLADPAYALAGTERAFRDALFQVLSIGTTTGYVNTDYGQWPAAPQFILLLLMFMGGMAGSTAGGMKVIRVYVLFRHGATQIRKAIHPRAIVVTRVGRKTVREDILLNILAFVLLFLGLFAAGVLALTLLGHDLVTAIGASAATIGNIGPGLGAVGAVENYGWMGGPSQLLLTFLMLVGRLEIFTVLLLFHPDLWQRSEH